MADLKKVYTAVTEDEALENLMMFKEKWGKQYSFCVKSWEDNWDILSTFSHISLRFGESYTRPISLKGSTASSGKSLRTSPALPMMILCVRCYTWPAGKLSSIGLPAVEIGTWFWLSFSSCSRIARPSEPSLIIAFPG